jgi:hypothetical protein
MPAEFRSVFASSGVELNVVARCFFNGLPITESFGRMALPNIVLAMFNAGVVADDSAGGGVAVPTGVPVETGDSRAPARGSAECWRFSCQGALVDMVYSDRAGNKP